jgi:CBS domain-containing protein
VLTAGDIARGIGRPDADLLDAGDLMTPWGECYRCPVDMLVIDAIELMQVNGIMACPVVVPGTEANVVGILHLHDCLRAGVL